MMNYLNILLFLLSLHLIPSPSDLLVRDRYNKVCRKEDEEEEKRVLGGDYDEK
jgi:hypothetical protein